MSAASTTPATQDVLLSREGPVTVISLNRPGSLNALVPGMMAALLDMLRLSSVDPACRVVVLTGAGRSFCAGMDRKHSAAEAPDEVIEAGHHRMREAVDVIRLLRSMPQPVLAAVRGHAVGAGFALAAAADIRLAAPDSSFHAIFTRIGLSAGDLGLSWFLPRQVGPSAAAELLFTGGVLDAARAAELGFVSRISDDPLASALALAAVIASQPSLGVRMSKELLSASIAAAGLDAHLELEMRSQLLCRLASAQAGPPLHQPR